MQLVEAPTIEDVNQILNEVADVYFLQEVIA
jgi:hypothetical protein